MRYYRQAGELEGKELSAQTIAALMASQGADDPSALRSGRPMPARLLEFLLRHRAIRYWRRNRWLKSDPFNDQLTLTPEGLDKIRGRLNGNGEAGGQSVSTSDVIEQFQILTGRLTAQGLDSFVWPPGAEGPPAREGSAQEGNPRPDESAGQVEIAAPADAKLTSLQRKILAYLATHDGWATRQDMYGFTGYERGYSKALGAATKGPAKAGTLEALGYVERQGDSRGLQYRITEAGRGVALGRQSKNPEATRNLLRAVSQLTSAVAVQDALDEFVELGRQAFLSRHGFHESLDLLVLNPMTGLPADALAIAGAAFGREHAGLGNLHEDELASGVDVASRLERLGFQVIDVRQVWRLQETRLLVHELVRATGESLDGRKPTMRELALQITGRSLARPADQVEARLQELTAAFELSGLPTLEANSSVAEPPPSLLKSVEEYLSDRPSELTAMVDNLETVHLAACRSPGDLIEVQPPEVCDRRATRAWSPLAKSLDYVARDAANSELGKAGERWVLEFERKRLRCAGLPELAERVIWASQEEGDGLGYDIRSYDLEQRPRHIEVKTTNAGIGAPFVVTRNELEVSRRLGAAFYLYRVFDFGSEPKLFVLQGDLAQHVQLEPTEYRASFSRLRSESVS